MPDPDPVTHPPGTVSDDETLDKIGHDVITATPSPSKSQDSIGTEWDNSTLVGRRHIFPATNLQSKLHKVDKFDSRALRAKYFILDEFEIIRQGKNQKIYHWVERGHQWGVSISTASLECGLRFLLHPLVDKLLVHWQIGLSQLIPNSFLQINSFIARCRLLNIPRNVHVFLSIYQLSSNAKYKGFYSINRRSGLPSWCSNPNSVPPGHKGSHEEWFYILGPRIVKYARWYMYENLKLKNSLPNLSTREEKMYQTLVDHGGDFGDNVNPKNLHKETWLSEHHISCRGVDMDDEVHRALLARKQQEKEELAAKKKNKKKQKHVTVTESESGVEISSGKKTQLPLVILETHVEAARTSKRPREDESIVDISLITADLSAIRLGRKVSEPIIALSDQALSTRNTSTLCSEQVIAMLSQAMTWANAHATSSKMDEGRMKQLEKSADAAEDRATDMQQKWVASEKELQKILDREAQLKKDLADAQKKLYDADAKILDARVTHYERGLNERMKMVAEAGLDYSKILQEYDIDVWEEIYLQATGLVPEKYILDPRSRPNYESDSPPDEQEGGDESNKAT